MSVTIRTIVTATDFSAFSETALSYAREIALKFAAQVHLVHVLERPEDVPWWLAEQEYHARRGTLEQEARRHLDETVRRCLDGVAAQADLKTGRAADQVVETAREVDADLIIIATHGRGGLSRVLFGSVTENVVRHAPCPVLTVRPERSDKEDTP
jgi:nucleotide-binding universal stress UspA family protein